MARRASVHEEANPGPAEAVQVNGSSSRADLGLELSTEALPTEISDASESIAEYVSTPEEEAKFEEAMRKWRAWREHAPQKVSQLRRHARAAFKAMDGWHQVETDEDWENLCETASDQYRSGHFFLEQLGAQRFLNPALFATLWMLRDGIVDDMVLESPVEYMLVDLMMIGYYNTLRVQGWMGDLALETEREFFDENGPTKRMKKRYGHGVEGLYVEHRLQYANHTLLPLLDRCNRMMVRNLRALQELRRTPAPQVNIGNAGQVNVASQQVNS